MTNKYRLLLFDLDDTLVDYQETEDEALKKTYEKYFRNYTECNKFLDKFKQINLNLWDKYRSNQLSLDDLRQNRFSEVITYFHANVSVSSVIKDYETSLYSLACLFSDVRETLKYLKLKYQICLVTNGIAKIQKKKLSRLKIKSFFDYVVISGKVGHKKPGVEFFEYVLNLTKVPHSEALMIGDSLEHDFIGARKARIDFCWVNRKNLIRLEEYPRPEYEIHNLSELKKLL